jgi:hypothetical protein
MSVTRITHYGTDADPFVRVVDDLREEGDTLVIDRKVFARGYAKDFQVSVEFMSQWERLAREHIVYAVLDGVAAVFGS